jgi:putative membrane protein
VSVPPIPTLFFSHWELTPSLDLELAAVAGLYLWGVRRVRSRWPAKRTIAFLSGLGWILVALQSGLDTYDGTLLSVHMVQHLILLLAAPLCLLWGRPVMLALRALPRRGRQRLAAAMVALRPLGHWTVGLAAFYAAVLVPHVPAFFDASLRHPLIHDAQHLVFLLGGLLFFWPLFGSPLGRRALGSVGSMSYVIASMPSCALIGAYLNRYPHALYAPYAHIDRLLGISAVTDQYTAGALMWVGAHVILTAVTLWVLGAKLVAEERRQQVRDEIEARAALGGLGTEVGR